MELWEDLNAIMLQGGLNKVMNDLLIEIENPKMPLDLDLGRLFNYTENKWKNLLRNYIIEEHLKEVKSLWEIGKKSISHNFANKHKGSGKACLTSLIVSKRVGKKPNIAFVLRASEVTKRLLCDLILFWRIGKYIFGTNEFTITLYINQAYSDGATAFMFLNHMERNGKIDSNKYINDIIISGKVIEKYIKFKDIKKITDISYKIYRRVFKVLHPEQYKYPRTLVRDCKLF